MPLSVQHFLDERQWKDSKIPVRMVTDSNEFVKIALNEYLPTYIVRNWIVAHLPDQIVYMDLNGFSYDGDVSIKTESKYLVCGLFQEPVSLLHHLVKLGKTVTLSYRPILEDSSMLSRSSIKYKEISKPLKFLVEVTKRRCKIFVFLKFKEVENGRKKSRNGSERT